MGWIIIMVALVSQPLAEFRPNRVVKGVSLGGPGILGQYSTLITVAFLLVLGLYVFKDKLKRYLGLELVPWLLAIIPGVLLWIFAFVRMPDAITDLESLRISLSSGFWLLLVGIILVQSSAPLGRYIIGLTFLMTFCVVGIGGSPFLSLYKEYLNVQAVFITEFWRHLTLALSSVLFSVLPGILLGFWCHRSAKAQEIIMGFVNTFQVIPTLSLLGLMMIPLTMLSKEFPVLSDMGIKGIGFAPAFIVLCLYCLLPITSNAYAGFHKVDQGVIDSAVALGMNPQQVFWKVSLPLATPVILSGIRTAVTQNIGNTILAGLIGGGGMGALIFLGLSQSATDLVILGTLPVVALALLSDLGFEWLETKIIRKVGQSA